MPADLFDVLRGAADAAPFVKIVHPGDPMAWPRPQMRIVYPRRGRPFIHVYKHPTAAVYQRALQWRAKAEMNGRQPSAMPIAVRFFAILPIPSSWPNKKRDAALHPTYKFDVDNIFKLAADAFNGIIYKDDGQIVRLLAVKEYGEKPGIIFEVYEL